MKKVTELLGDLYGLVSASMGPNGKAVMINIHSPKQIVVTKVIGIIMGPRRPHEKATSEAAFSRPPTFKRLAYCTFKSILHYRFYIFIMQTFIMFIAI